MRAKFALWLLSSLMLIPFLKAETLSLHVDCRELVFSGVQGLESDPIALTLSNLSRESVERAHWEIAGEHAESFRVSSVQPFGLESNLSSTQRFSFCPPAGVLGSLRAKATLLGESGDSLLSVDLFGLSAVGVEGPREPGLYLIADTVGLSIDLGWKSHHTHTRPELIGSEIGQQRFKKANSGQITLTPIARYSPDFLLPFGYYRSKEDEVAVTPIGTLSLKTVTRFEHNCLYPKLVSGTTTFDPGSEPFGVFTSSPTHVAYSEDKVNARLEPKHIEHAVRVYPAFDRDGYPMPNAYLICFEEATNGDYQDYVFLIDNVVAVD